MFSRMTKKSSLLSAISASSKDKDNAGAKSPSVQPSTPATPSGATSNTPAAAAATVTVEKQQSKERAKRLLLSKLTMEASADAGNNNNTTVEADKTVVNSDGQAKSTAAAAVEKKIVSGTAPSAAVSAANPVSAPQTNNNSVQVKTNGNLKPPETPDAEGYTLGAGIAREKSATATRWSNRVGAQSPGSDESRPMSPSMDNHSGAIPE